VRNVVTTLEIEVSLARDWVNIKSHCYLETFLFLFLQVISKRLSKVKINYLDILLVCDILGFTTKKL
jgi:hypothetical protein